MAASIRDMKVKGKEPFTFKSRREADRMEEFYSEHELEIMMQFYHICKRVIHDTKVDCLRKLSNDEPCVIVSSELVENELNRQSFMEDYITDVDVFHVLDMDIEVKDELLFQALERLSENQRNIMCSNTPKTRS